MTRTTNPFARLARSVATIEPHELRATLLAFFFVFTLMSAYFILRPVRDAMSSDWSDVELSVLWSSTFVVSVIAVALYGAVVSRIRFQWLVPAVYLFFSLSFFVFRFAADLAPDPMIVDQVFYVWISVFSLFHISVFWSFMSDVFSKQQAPRLFAFIAMGSSVGAIVGPLVPALFAPSLGTENLILVAAVLLLVPLPIIHVLTRLKVTELGNADVAADLSEAQRIGRNPLAGFMLFFRSPFLLGIGAFILLYVALGSFVYFELKNLLDGIDRDQRTQIWAFIDAAVNTLAILTALLVTSRIAKRFGMAVTLAMIPLMMVLGMLIVAFVPAVAAVVGLQIARRAGNYAITRPGREMLFTMVDRETRFKAKPVIDIAVYRGGDMLTAWAFTGLTTGIGLGLGAVALVGAVLAAIWAAVGAWLGRVYDRTDALATPAAGRVEPTMDRPQ